MADPLSSRLSRMIERLLTQRACIEWAAEQIRDRTGPVVELGLGKGRTYDHWRRLLPGRPIYCFDKEIHATPDCIPEPQWLFHGDFRETLPGALLRMGKPATVVHADIGSENPERDRRLAADLAPLIDGLLAPDALVLSDRAMHQPGWEPQPLPPGVGRWEYFIYRKADPASVSTP